MEVQELRRGLWRWKAAHPDWDEQLVSSAYLEAPGAVCLIDPLVPRDDEERFLAALDRDVERLGLPVAIVLTNPWHRRSGEELATRYAGEIVVAVEGGLPGGLRAYPGGMQPDDVVLHARSHAALFTGDTLFGGRLCPESWLAEGREHQLACLRRVADLEVDLVVPAHGEPLTGTELAKLLHSPPSAE